MSTFLQLMNVHIREQIGNGVGLANIACNHSLKAFNAISAGNTPLSFTRLDTNEQDQIGQETILIPQLASDHVVMSKAHDNLLSTNLYTLHGEKILLHEADCNANLALALRPAHRHDLFHLLEQNKDTVTLCLQLDTALVEKNKSQQQCLKLQRELHQARTQLVKLRESSDLYRKHAAEDLTRHTQERFDLECSLQQLQDQLTKDKGIEQMQINSLQQALAEARLTHQKRERELQALLEKKTSSTQQEIEELNSKNNQLSKNQSLLIQALEDNQALLDQTRAEYQQRESNLQAVLDETNQSAKENLSRTEADYAQRIQALIDQKEHLEVELAATQKANNDAEAEHQKIITSLESELDQAQQNIAKLEQIREKLCKELHHEQETSQARQEQLTQTMEAEKQLARKEQSHLSSQIKDLNVQLEKRRAKANRLGKKLMQLKTMLEKKHQQVKHLYSLVKSNEEDMAILKQCLANEELDQQKLNIELQQMVKDNQLAWEKVSDFDLDAQMAKQELATIKSELEQENAMLRAELEHNLESNELAQGSHFKERDSLLKSLEEYKAAQKIAENTIQSLKSEQQSLCEAKSEFNRQIEQLKADFHARQSEYNTTIKSNRREVMELRKQLGAVNARKTDPAELKKLRLALRQAEDEKASLKLKIDGLHQTQLKMERQLSKDKQIRIKRSLSVNVSRYKQRRTKRSSSFALPSRQQSRDLIRMINQSNRFRLRNRSMNIQKCPKL